jgi:hypothetical protein
MGSWQQERDARSKDGKLSARMGSWQQEWEAGNKSGKLAARMRSWQEGWKAKDEVRFGGHGEKLNSDKDNLKVLVKLCNFQLAFFLLEVLFQKSWCIFFISLH